MLEPQINADERRWGEGPLTAHRRDADEAAERAVRRDREHRERAGAELLEERASACELLLAAHVLRDEEPSGRERGVEGQEVEPRVPARERGHALARVGRPQREAAAGVPLLAKEERDAID